MWGTDSAEGSGLEWGCGFLDRTVFRTAWREVEITGKDER